MPKGRERMVEYRTGSVLCRYSPPSYPVFQIIKRMIVKPLFSMSKQEQMLQTEKEPEIQLEIKCPRCYDIMVLSNDFDRLCYFCEECNLLLNKIGA